ncbi:hypothetical protein C8Q76DRAFT_173717 [Earliella scabrosa]|nr:hypothetical protein C8Q76DRAFT_173717 [Earliella scabrosa]
MRARVPRLPLTAAVCSIWFLRRVYLLPNHNRARPRPYETLKRWRRASSHPRPRRRRGWSHPVTDHIAIKRTTLREARLPCTVQ